MAGIININLIQPINEAQEIVANASILLKSCGEEDKKIILKEVAVRINFLGKIIKGDLPSKDLPVQELAIRYVKQHPILHPFFSELFPKVEFPEESSLFKEEVLQIYAIKIFQHLERIGNALNDDINKESISLIENQLKFIPVVFKKFPKLAEDVFKKLCIIYTNYSVKKRSILVHLLSNEISSHLNLKEKQHFCFSILEEQKSEFSKELLREIAATKERQNTSKDVRSYADLPEDILDVAFSYLSIGDTLECALVCKIWYRVVHPQANGFLWKKLIKRDYEILYLKNELMSNQECFLSYQNHYVSNSNLKRGRYALQILEGHNDLVNLLVRSPNGTTLASSSKDGEIRIWDIATKEKKCVLSLKGPQCLINSLVFCPDGTKLCVLYFDTKIKIWDIKTGDSLNIIEGYDEGVFSFAFSPDGSKLCCGYDNGKILIYEIATGIWSEIINLVIPERGARVQSRRRFGSGVSSGVEEHLPLADEEFPPFKGGVLQIEGQDRSHGIVNHLAFSPDGNLLCSGSYENSTIKIWNMTRKECIYIHPINVPSDGGSIVFSPNSRAVCIRSARKIEFWNITMEEGFKSIKSTIGYNATLPVFSPDGRMLCAACKMSQREVIKFWNVTTGKCLKSLNYNHHVASSFAFNPEGSLFCAGFDDGIRVWDTMTGSCLHTFTGTKYRGASFLNFSADGRALYFISSPRGTATEYSSYAPVVKILNFDADSAQILLNIADLFHESTEESIAEAMQRFETLSLQKKNSIYEKLSGICNPSEIFHLHYGKHLFYGKNGFSSTAQEKAQAIQLYLNESSHI